MNSIDLARHRYAEELRFTAKVNSRAVVSAFATVPRERFVGAGPWRIRSPMNMAEYWTTPDDDPGHVYHDVLIALDETRNLNNGQPSLWAFLLDQLDIRANDAILHLACGTGYYTAIAAELVGSAGKITAVEIDTNLAAKARDALDQWPQVTVKNIDGAAVSFDAADVIMASAGATHPLQSWLDALKPKGRLLFPMTSARRGPGAMLLITRRGEGQYTARFLCWVGFIDFQGARQENMSRRLAAALRRDRGSSVKSLRRDIHTRDDACWLHGKGWCLSRLPIGEAT